MKAKRILSLALTLVIIASLSLTTAIPASADLGDHQVSESESNNTIATADRIYHDDTVSGTLSGYDVDHFKFVISQRSKISIDAVSSKKLNIGIVNSAGNSICAGTYRGISSNGYYQYTIDTTLNSGTYYPCLFNDESGVSASYMLYIEIEEVSIPATSVSITRNSLELFTGEQYSLGYSATPSGQTEYATWHSSDPGVVTVTQGNVTAIAPGSATITVTLGNCIDTCMVTVKDIPNSGAHLYGGGSGTETDPYIIKTKLHLDNVRYDLSAYYQMNADIEFTEADFAEGGEFCNNGEGWKPIGADSSNAFSGIFDGNGHAITGLKIYIPPLIDDGYIGLFGYTSGAEIKNLGMVNSNIYVDGGPDLIVAGGVVGYAKDTTIYNCYNMGSVIADAYKKDISVGGMVGYGESCTIMNCYNMGDVKGEASNSYGPMVQAGGVVGTGKSCTIMSCYNTGSVTTSSYNARVGGIVGYAGSKTTITNCYNKGNSYYSGGSGSSGGIVGIVADGGSITNCYNTGSVAASSGSFTAYAGGIGGQATDSTVTNCYNTGDVTAESTSSSSYGNASAGGIMGHGETVTNCYNTGSVTAASSADSYAGGIVGLVENAGSITNCYNTGSVTAASSDDSYAGGIAGYAYGTTITNCYYLNTISKGVGYGSDTTISCTKEQMQQQATFIGFDFDTVWTMAGNEDYFYPELQNVSMAYSKTLQSIAVTTMPTKLTYLEEAEALDITGGQITLTYDNDTTEVVNITPEMVTGFDNTIVGTQTLTVTYEGKTATYKIEILKGYTIGDLDGDDEITDWDGILLSRYLAGWSVDIENIEAMDCDGDGEITDWDSILLSRYLAGWTVNSQIGK